MREFEPVVCPRCERHVDPEEYDEVDETCDACRRETDIHRELKKYADAVMVSTPEGQSWAYQEMDPLDQPWGGLGGVVHE